jgi:N6-L-threonylcarbamoyladenine synthase
LTHKDTYILGIESSCDDTSAAILKNGKILANITANQEIHQKYGGVVPELASRAHQANIVAVVNEALKVSNISKKDLSAIAFTRGPGLLGALLVGTSFAKGLALALNIPLIEVNHIEAHIHALFVQREGEIKMTPNFPFLCLTVSGGHTQITMVKDYFDFEILGKTIDDAAGEAFDKIGKVLGLPYPAGPHLDKLAQNGNPEKFSFAHPNAGNFHFSFSGLKTSVLYFLQKMEKENPDFIAQNLNDLCASVQKTIVDILLKQLNLAAKTFHIKEIAIAGGVSANSELRNRILKMGKNQVWQVYIPEFQFCTDNAAMIAMSGHYKYLKREFSDQSITASARM